MTKHTPGPWVIGEPHPTNACTYVCDDEGHEVATLYYCSEGGIIGKDGIWPEQPNRDANARLIAAAPDMLEALQALANWGPFQNGYAPDDAFSKIQSMTRAAIAKATGG